MENSYNGEAGSKTGWCSLARCPLWRARWLSNGNAKWAHSKKQDRLRSPHFVFAKELKLKKRLQKFRRAFYVKERIRERICLTTKTGGASVQTRSRRRAQRFFFRIKIFGQLQLGRRSAVFEGEQTRVRPIVIFWLLGRYLIPGI